MEWLLSHAANLELLVGVAGAAWAFFTRLDRAYKQHLKEELASKSDLAQVASQIDRLEAKLDEILLDGFRQSNTRRYRVKKRARATT